jgi:hypothetical protein
MTMDLRVLELALIGLEAERERIDREISRLRQQGDRMDTADDRFKNGRLLSRPSPNKGKKMSAGQKKAISASMKATWAQRRAAQVGPTAGNVSHKSSASKGSSKK